MAAAKRDAESEDLRLDTLAAYGNQKQDQQRAKQTGQLQSKGELEPHMLSHHGERTPFHCLQGQA